MTSRQVFKSALAGALYYSGADRLIGRGGRDTTPLILGYHRVCPDFETSVRSAIPSMLVSADTFERHIDLLARRYTFVTLDEAASRIREGRPGPPAAVITFDDGYRDVYEQAFPVLQRKGIPSAVFVVSGVAGTGSLLLHDELYLLLLTGFRVWSEPSRELRWTLEAAGLEEAAAAQVTAEVVTPYEATRALLSWLPHALLLSVVERLRGTIDLPERELGAMALMDWDMLATMGAAGHTIGSHTRTHAFLVNEPVEVIAEELRSSRLHIQTELSRPVEHLAYPNGDFNPVVAAAAREAGYRYAYTVCSCRDEAAPELTIPRHMMWERSGMGLADRFSPMLFECETRGVFDSLMGCGRAHAALRP